MDEKNTTVSIAVAEPYRDERTNSFTERDATPSPASPSSTSEVRPRSMARKKVSTTVYIEPEQAEKLRTLHERTKVPVAVYIREGIELALAKYAHLLPGQLTLEPPAGTPPTRKE